MHSSRSVASTEAGFSLLEVVVATGLMGVVLVVLLQLLSGAWRAQEAVQNHTRALQVAEQVLEEYSNTKVLRPGKYQGQEGRFSYLVSLDTQYEISDPNFEGRISCFLMGVTVSWRERGRTRSLALQTVRSVVQKKS